MAKQQKDKNLCSFFFEPQIVYDEGPLYVFAKSEDVRAQWIKKLKESKDFLPGVQGFIPRHIKTRTQNNKNDLLSLHSGAVQQRSRAQVPSLLLAGWCVAVLPTGS